jgi:hypothetical protein
MNCDDIRTALALQPASDDTTLQEHIDGCAACARYRRQHQTLDVVLRAELHWESPAALSARLLALAANPDLARQARLPAVRAAQLPAAPARSRPQGWYVTSVYALTLAIVGLSLLFAWQFVGLLMAQVPLDAALTQILALPGQGLAYLTQTLPQSRIVVAFFLSIRDQMLWLLLVAVLWAALDKWNPQLTFRGRQISL